MGNRAWTSGQKENTVLVEGLSRRDEGWGLLPAGEDANCQGIFARNSNKRARDFPALWIVSSYVVRPMAHVLDETDTSAYTVWS